MSKKKQLGTYDGREILAVTLAVTNAGDGLSKALEAEPKEVHLGDTVYVVLECEAAKVRYEPIKDTEGLRLVNILKAGRATFVDADLVAEVLDDMDRRIEEENGVTRLFDKNGDPTDNPEAAVNGE